MNKTSHSNSKWDWHLKVISCELWLLVEQNWALRLLFKGFRSTKNFKLKFFWIYIFLIETKKNIAIFSEEQWNPLKSRGLHTTTTERLRTPQEVSLKFLDPLCGRRQLPGGHWHLYMNYPSSFTISSQRESLVRSVSSDLRQPAGVSGNRLIS